MAEIYIKLIINEDDRSWSLAHDIWSLPMSNVVYNDLETCRRIGNAAAHAEDQEGMTHEAAEQAMAAAANVAVACVSRARNIRARL